MSYLAIRAGHCRIRRDSPCHFLVVDEDLGRLSGASVDRHVDISHYPAEGIGAGDRISIDHAVVRGVRVTTNPKVDLVVRCFDDRANGPCKASASIDVVQGRQWRLDPLPRG